jgi:hypothetical protein
VKTASSLPGTVSGAAISLVGSIPDADGNPIFEEAVGKTAVRDFAWALLERFPDQEFAIF